MWWVVGLACVGGGALELDSDTAGGSAPDFGARWELRLLDEQDAAYADLLAADFDQDGALDLMAGPVDSVAFFPGPFDTLPARPSKETVGAFGYSWEGSPLAVDLDQDGFPEAVGAHISAANGYAGAVGVHDPLSGEVTLWSGDGDGPHAGGYLGWDLDSLGDQDGDGVVELLLSTYAGPAYVVSGDAPSGPVDAQALGTVAFTGQFGGHCATSDLNGDGIVDLAVSESVFLGPFFGHRDADDADAGLAVAKPVLLTHPAGSGAPELWGVAGDRILRFEDPLTLGTQIASWELGLDMDEQLQVLGDVDQDGWLETTLEGLDEEARSVHILRADTGDWGVREDAVLEISEASKPAVVELADGGVGLVVLRGSFAAWDRPESTSWLLYEIY